MKQVFLFPMLRSLALLFLVLLTGCKKVVDLGIRPLEGETTILNKDCKIKSLDRSDGLKFTLEYSEDRPVKLTGNLPDFDVLEYNGNLLTRAILSTNPNSSMVFGFDNKGNLTNINFKGVDARGPFDHPATLKYDSKNRLTEMSLFFPLFTQAAVVTFEYDNNDNITKVKRQNGVKIETLLENHTFDDKKSPFLDQKIGPILSYLMVYTLLQGDANYSYFLNKNNVTSATISNDKGVTELSMEYDYNQDDYPTNANIVKSFEGRIKQATEVYSYLCK